MGHGLLSWISSLVSFPLALSLISQSLRVASLLTRNFIRGTAFPSGPRYFYNVKRLRLVPLFLIEYLVHRVNGCWHRSSKEKIMTATIGRIVHYTSYGTPNGEYPSVCRAAIVTAVGEEDGVVSLCVLNPEGIYLNQNVFYSDEPKGGTWHWPDRV
jgi:hypothetical protein